MAGEDYTLAGIAMNVQFTQEYSLDYDWEIRNDEFEGTMTFLARKDYFRKRLLVELFSSIGLNHGDVLVRPKVTYAFADGFKFLGGASIFLGDKGRFGQFSDNDMVYVEVKYSF